VAVLRRAFPDGPTVEEYRALISVLRGQYSDRGLSAVLGELTGRHPAEVSNDAADWPPKPVAPPGVVEDVRARLDAVGWDWCQG
jgi:hypothetical protein